MNEEPEEHHELPDDDPAVSIWTLFYELMTKGASR